MYEDKRQNVWLLIVKSIIGVILPFLVSGIFLYIHEGQLIANIMPTWNDEDFYYHQIKAILEYGQPLGYYGYDGSHAMFGNFGFHGFIILLPYVLFSAVFGLEYYTIALVNILFLSITNIVYMLLYKPDLKRLLSFAVLVLSPMVMFYTNTNMMEGENYFFAIISALLMVYILHGQNTEKITVVLGMIIVWAVLSKVTWTILVLPYMLILLRNRRLKNFYKVIVSIAITALCGVTGYLIFCIFRADYFKGLSVVGHYVEYLSAEGLVQGIPLMIKKIIDNFVLTWCSAQPVWLEVSRIFIIIILLMTLVFFYFNDKEDYLAIIPSIVILGFIVGVAALYAGGGPAIRTIYSGAVFAEAFMLVNLLRTEGYHKKKKWFAVLFFFFLSGFIIQKMGSWDYRNYYDEAYESDYEKIRHYMSNIQLDTSASEPWENTLVMVMDSVPAQIYELCMPVGTGINYYMDIPEAASDIQAKYILLSIDNLEDLNNLEAAGFTVLSSDEKTVLLGK